MSSDDAGTGSPVPALQARNLAKRFGAQLALAGVDLTIAQGEVLALLGENGSGKSTFVKVLSGFHVPEPGGQLWVAGREVPLPVPQGQYRDVGLSFVYQDLGLGLGLRVVENLYVGRRVGNVHRGLNPIMWPTERRAARAVLESYHVDLDPNAMVGSLRPTAQALLAIVRAAEDLRMFRERSEAAVAGQKSQTPHGVLVLDEPTVFLPQDEKVFLFDLVRRVVQSGTAVLFVSHDMPAIRELSDRAVILRDGAVIGDVSVPDTTDERLVELISGHRMSANVETAAARAVESVVAPAPERVAEASASGPLLQVSGVRGGQLRSAGFSVGIGEIVGVAGLLGSGAEDLPYALFGALPGAAGKIQIGDWSGDLARFTPHDAREAGLALVPADRKQQGIAQALTVGENMMSLVLGQYFQRGLLARRRLRRTADERARAFGVRPPDSRAPISSLSGGNQQRVVLARWLEDPPLVLVLHEPTQGVDVATRAELYEMLRHLAGTGIAIVWVSTDFDELAEVSHRVLICSGGLITSEITAQPITRDRITAEVYAASSQPLVQGA